MTEAIATETGRSAHIRPALRAALTLLVHEGLTITAAAQRAGLQRESLSKALKRPHVQAALTDLRRAWSSNETAKAWLVVARLAQSACSEDVQLKAAKVLLEAAGELTPRDQGTRPSGVMVQIVVGDVERRDVRITDGASNGVIEAEPFCPPPRPLGVEGGDA